MLEFSCPECGQRLKVKPQFTGRESTCPKCSARITVPAQTTGISLDFESNPSFGLDEQGNIYTKEEKTPTPEIMLIREKEKQEELQREKELCTRKYNVLFDIFLYPLSKPCMEVMTVLIGLPALMLIFIGISVLAAYSMPAMIVGVVLLYVILVVLSIVLALYYTWYFTECVRDSAEGHVRAPETVAITPDIFGLLGRNFLVDGALAISAIPLSYTLIYEGGSNAIFYIGLAMFLLPMMLLSVSYFGNLSGLNIFRVIWGIAKTFFSYLILIAALAIWTLIVSVIIVPMSGIPVLASMLALPVTLYLGLVYAHIIGRFYYLKRDKLNWEN